MPPWLTIAVGLVLLSAGADLLVRCSVALGRRAGLSSLFLGLTVVAFGTSSPELFASLASASHGRPDLAVGNVVGSNVFNVAVILGLTALLRPIPVAWAGVRGDVLLTAVAAACPWLALFSQRTLSRPAGVLMFAVLVVYLGVRFRQSREKAPARPEGAPPERVLSVPRAATGVAVGLALLIVGADRLVAGSVDVARAFGVSELVIGLTIVAAGTSAPELFTSLVAAVRGEMDVAVGNIVGSNLFNAFGILGLTAVYRPPRIADQVLLLDTPVMLLASLALLPILWTGQRITRAEGALLLGSYGAYLWILIARAPAWFG